MPNTESVPTKKTASEVQAGVDAIGDQVKASPSKIVLIVASGVNTDENKGASFIPLPSGSLGWDHIAVAWEDKTGDFLRFGHIVQGVDDREFVGYGEKMKEGAFGSVSEPPPVEALVSNYSNYRTITLDLSPYGEKVCDLFKEYLEKALAPGNIYSHLQNGHNCTSVVLWALREAFKEAGIEIGTWQASVREAAKLMETRAGQPLPSDPDIEKTLTKIEELGDVKVHTVIPNDLYLLSIFLLAQSNEAKLVNGEVVFDLGDHQERFAAADVKEAILMWGPELAVRQELSHLSEVLELVEGSHVEPDNPDPEESAGMAYREGVPSHPKWGDTPGFGEAASSVSAFSGESVVTDGNQAASLSEDHDNAEESAGMAYRENDEGASQEQVALYEEGPLPRVHVRTRVEPDNPDPEESAGMAYREGVPSHPKWGDTPGFGEAASSVSAFSGESVVTDGNQAASLSEDHDNAEESAGMAGREEPDPDSANSSIDVASRAFEKTLRAEDARTDGASQQPATDDDRDAPQEQVALASDNKDALTDDAAVMASAKAEAEVKPSTDDQAGPQLATSVPDTLDDGFSYAAFAKPGVTVEVTKEVVPVEQFSPEGSSSSGTPESESAHPDIASEDVGNAAPTKEPVVHHGDLTP